MATESSPALAFPLALPVDVLLSVATIPVLVGLLGTRVVVQSVIELGRASEEVFRGDRLPVLNLQNSASTDGDAL